MISVLLALMRRQDGGRRAGEDGRPRHAVGCHAVCLGLQNVAAKGRPGWKGRRLTSVPLTWWRIYVEVRGWRLILSLGNDPLVQGGSGEANRRKSLDHNSEAATRMQKPFCTSSHCPGVFLTCPNRCHCLFHAIPRWQTLWIPNRPKPS